MSRRLALAGALALTACARPPDPPTRNLIAEQHPATTTTTTETASTVPTLPAIPRSTHGRVSRNAARPRTGASASAAGVATGQGAGGIHLSATAYCETGRTANGQHPYWGSAAGNRWPFGTRLRIIELGQVVTINDRIGHGSDLDIAFPGDCPGARRFGRRTVTVVAA